MRCCPVKTFFLCGAKGLLKSVCSSLSLTAVYMSAWVPGHNRTVYWSPHRCQGSSSPNFPNLCNIWFSSKLLQGCFCQQNTKLNIVVSFWLWVHMAWSSFREYSESLVWWIMLEWSWASWAHESVALPGLWMTDSYTQTVCLVPVPACPKAGMLMSMLVSSMDRRKRDKMSLSL